MAKWVVLLRGINVGKGNRLPMAPLRQALQEHAQFRTVQTYIQSGNLVVDSPLRRSRAVAAIVAETIESNHGFRPRVMVIGCGAFRQAIDQNPYTEATGQPKSLHLYFLDEVPSRPDLMAMEQLKSSTEQFQLIGSVLYLLTPDGLAKSKLAEKAEKLLGVPATARNYNTVQALSEMANA